MEQSIPNFVIKKYILSIAESFYAGKKILRNDQPAAAICALILRVLIVKGKIK